MKIPKRFLFAGVFFVLAAALSYESIVLEYVPVSGILLWLALDLFLLSIAYLFNLPQIFGKRSDGSRPFFLAIIWTPWLLTTQLVFWLQNSFSRANVYQKVAEGLYLGRRCHREELPPDVEVVVDLTAEFVTNKYIYHACDVRCLPVLDGSVPHDLEEFTRLVTETEHQSRPIYVHCANGSGRGAMFVIALLLRREVTDNLDEAINLVTRQRPQVRLNAEQYAFLQRAINPSGSQRDALKG
ncbi:MAG: hypothetical protein CMJ46_03290 [Planctomyces sp.]|nr:hypothetical protein [Planctomyces sp.]